MEKRILQVKQSLRLSLAELGGKLDNTPKGTVNLWVRGLAIPPRDKVKIIVGLDIV